MFFVTCYTWTFAVNGRSSFNKIHVFIKTILKQNFHISSIIDIYTDSKNLRYRLLSKF